MPFDFQNYAGRNFAPKRELDELTEDVAAVYADEPKAVEESNTA